jgi:putative endonuclease
MSRETEMTENPWFVYMVRCSDGSFYTGIAKDLEKRVKKHNSGKGAVFTRGRRPVSLVYRERQANQSSALKRERQIKKWKRPNKEKLIRDFTAFQSK